MLFRSGKYLLKKIAAKNFGSDFAFRRKVGFDIPVRELFANSRFKEFLSDKIIPGMKNRGLFKHELPLRWLDNITTINYHQLEALWIVVSFEIWASLYLDSNNDNRFKRR
mgnify:FL=1